MGYDTRYCAFVDILGFSELINQLARNTISSENLRDLLRIVHAPPRGDYIRFFKGSDLRVQSISDAVCLSATYSAPGLAHLFYNIEELTRALLEAGFFVRGAVVKGNIYHDEQMVFGDGLIRAYHLEQEIVRYPRIFVTSEIAREVDTFLDEDIGEFSGALKQADDGPFFLHVLNTPEVVLYNETTAAERSKYADTYNRMAWHIQHRLDEAIDNPRYFEKVQWFARYWNSVMEPYAGEIALIKGAGLAYLHQGL